MRPSIEERKQSRKFVDVLLSEDGVYLDVPITVGELEQLASRFVSKNRVLGVIQSFEQTGGGLFSSFNDKNKQAEPQLIGAIERLLAGTLGASSARIVMKSLAQGNVGLEEVQAMVDEASEVFQFNRELLQGAIEHISMGGSVVDRDLRLVAWNHQYLELFEYPAELITIGRPIAEVIRYNAKNGLCGPGSVEDHVERRLSYMRQGTAHRSERQRPDGRVIQIQGNPMPGGGFVMSFTDISEFRHVEQALKEVNESLEFRVNERTKELSLLNVQLLKAKSQAEKANDQRARFFAAISHDLMQPMNAARLFTASLELEAKGSPQEPLAMNISSALQSAEHLLTDLLDMSRIEAGKMAVNCREVPIMKVLAPLKSEFALLAKAKGVTFRLATSDVWVNTDPVLLRRVLQNFLTNAVRYVGSDTQMGKVILGCRYLNDQRVRIEVRDNGPGIAQDKQQMIFSEFRRASSVGNGLGLGLAIAKGISRIIHGEIQVASEPGRGAVFSISVPACARRNIIKNLPVTSQSVGDLNLNVLCVDDEPAILQGMSTLLTRWGCRVRLASDGEQAMTMIHQETPDLLLADYHLGAGMSGLELIQQVREQMSYDIDAVLVSANLPSDIRQQCRVLTVSDLAKPVKPAAMRAILNRVVAKDIVAKDRVT